MKAILGAAALSFIAVSIPAAAVPIQPATSAIAETTIRPIVKINLNQADVQTLIHSIKGIGQKKAEAIIQYRKEHGAFKSIEDLAEVRGISRSFVRLHFAQLQEKFSVE